MQFLNGFAFEINLSIFIKRYMKKKKVREKSRECLDYKPQPFPDTKRQRKPTNANEHKSNKRTNSTKINSLVPKPSFKGE